MIMNKQCQAPPVETVPTAAPHPTKTRPAPTADASTVKWCTKINNFSYTHPIFPLFNHRVINPSIVNMSRRITYALNMGEITC